MRIVQHKTPSSERDAKAEPVEILGLSQNNPIDTVQLSSSPVVAHDPAVNIQASHALKAAINIQHKPNNIIHQPRK